MKIKKISSILSLLAIAQPMINNNQIFAKEIHNSKISENEVKNLDKKVESKSDDKKETLNPNVGKKDDIKTKNYKKIGTKAALSAALAAGLLAGATYGGWELYLHWLAYEANKYIGGVLNVTPAKYMDAQKEKYWCQLYAYQGLVNKETGIKPKVRDLYELAFPGDSSYDEKKFMQDDTTRKEFLNRVKTKYNINRKLYFETFDMKVELYDKKKYADSIEQTIWNKIVKAAKKCGGFCMNTGEALNEHAVLVTGCVDEENKKTVDYESYGKRFTVNAIDFIKTKVLIPYSKVQEPGDCKHDGVLRIYGYEK